MTNKKVKATTDYHEKQLQRALLQYSRPENANLVREALKLAGREDLIGNSPDCLVRPAFAGMHKFANSDERSKNARRGGAKMTTKGGKTASNGKKTNSNHQNASSNHKVKKPIYKKDEEIRRTKKSKLERVFGDDALRIRKEAQRLSNGSKLKGKNAKNHR